MVKIRLLVFIVPVLVLQAALAETGVPAAQTGRLAVLCGQLIDGRSSEIRSAHTVVIDNGRFLSLLAGFEPPAGFPTLDLSGHTCLPGLIDMHTHILEGPDELTDLTAYYDYTLQDFLDDGQRYALDTLRSGFTTVRNLASYYVWADVELRDQINRGEIAGPRVQAAGYFLSIPGGGGDLLEVGADSSVVPAELRMGIAQTPGEFAARAQLAIDQGVDVIKVIASGAVLAYGGVPGAPEMTPAQLAAVVSVANKAGVPVAAHAHGAQSIIEAIEAGADTIEHATYIDEEGIRLAIEHDVALSMDIGPGDWMIEEGKKAGWVEEFQRKVLETTHIQRVNFQKAHAAGVTMVFGSDAGIYPHGMAGIQFAHMVDWGMTPMQAIHAATSVAARYLGWADRVGAVEPGLYADLIAVKGNPLEEIRLLETVDVVVKGGQVIRSPVR